ncbi:hypothetical protein CASFOL_027847 [Castilleja foliolosa]|uniref:F-box domain-containing protein n=1 Tax=Castilleja foliolosa TaxID=1961234 RepID=A0ABD3CHK1_9LAMI
MANSVLPEDVMLCILTRLPVKTILRFKSVCKPWRDLFSSPEFRKLHHSQFSSDPKNQSFIVHIFSEDCGNPKNQFSIFNIESSKKKPMILDLPFAHTQKDNEFFTVGCCNGLVCIYRGHDIVLWNPAMKLFKTVPIKKSGPFLMVSLGFGYDAEAADFKVVKIVNEKRIVDLKKVFVITSAEMYSVKLDSWIAVNVSFGFYGFTDRNALTVNGNPYWVAWVDGNKGYLCFDVMELVFKFVPMRIWNDGLDKETYLGYWNIEVDLIDWNGALGSICYGNNHFGEPVDSLCVWVFDDGERVWRKKHTFGPLEEVDVFIFYNFTRNEKLLRCKKTGKLFVLQLETGYVNKLFYDICKHDEYEFFEYTESLAFIDGMEKYE